MSTEPPPPPDDDPLRKRPYGNPPPPGGSPYDRPSSGGSPYDRPSGGGPYDQSPGGSNPYDAPGQGPPGHPGGPYGAYGGGPYGPGPDPLAGMAPLADSGKRVLARVIDLVLVLAVVVLLSWAFNTTEFDYDMDGGSTDYGRSLGQSVIAAVLYMAYDTIMISRTGQTLGKRWLHLRVADLATGATPSVAANLVRAAVLWLPFAFCCACVWTAICGGYSFFDRPYKQGLHDKAAKTVVVSTG
jgi:uncharacterized RDD family membrane protein YckC